MFWVRIFENWKNFPARPGDVMMNFKVRSEVYKAKTFSLWILSSAFKAFVVQGESILYSVADMRLLVMRTSISVLLPRYRADTPYQRNSNFLTSSRCLATINTFANQSIFSRRKCRVTKLDFVPWFKNTTRYTIVLQEFYNGAKPSNWALIFRARRLLKNRHSAKLPPMV